MNTSAESIPDGSRLPEFAPRQRRTRDSLDRIRRAAAEILATEGPDQFSMAAVAERADVSVTAIYRRFKNKDDLLLDSKRAVLGEIGDALDAEVAAAGPAVEDALRAYARSLIAGLDERQELMRVLIAPTNSPEVQGVGVEMFTRTRSIFTEGVLSRTDDRSRRFVSAVRTAWEVLTFVPLNRVALRSDIAGRDEHTEQLVSMASRLLESAGE